MPVPTVMRWDHKNSPKITNPKDWIQIKNWYQVIFVDGYLADDDTTLIPPLGWDFEFDDGQYTITITMDTAGDENIVNKSRLLMTYKAIITQNYLGCQAKFYEHYSAGLITQWGKPTFDDSPDFGMPTFFNNDRTTDKICPYVVIGTNRGVYILGGFNNSITVADSLNPPFSTIDDYSTWQYFGDFVDDAIDYGRNNQCSTWGYDFDNSSDTRYNNCLDLVSWARSVKDCKVYIYNNPSAVFMGIRVNRNYNGESISNQYFTATPYGYYIPDNFTYGVYMGANIRFALKYPYPDGSLKIVPHELWTRETTTTNKQRDQVHIGKMPGLYYPLHYRPLSSGGNTKNIIEFEGSGEYEGQYFIGLARTGADEFYINITENWDI